MDLIAEIDVVLRYVCAYANEIGFRVEMNQYKRTNGPKLTSYLQRTCVWPWHLILFAVTCRDLC